MATARLVHPSRRRFAPPQGEVVTELKPLRVGGEVDGEPALRAFTTDRLGDFAADGVDSGDVVEPHAGRNRNVDFDELRSPDLGDVARIGLEAMAGDDRVHDASDMGV